MPRKKRPEEQQYWQHRPGFNWLLGYYEGKPFPSPDSGICERSIDRTVRGSCNSD